MDLRAKETHNLVTSQFGMCLYQLYLFITAPTHENRARTKYNNLKGSSKCKKSTAAIYSKYIEEGACAKQLNYDTIRLLD
ncbi:hypothetical protein GCM10025859_00600 [Alicyclobacillus fastidiosus]|nr:hypothetical protein GCM10025859_00600 [Alicyclobacillus fastidiosus]